MIHPLRRIIRPCVGMGIKLQQGHGPEFGHMGAQNRQGDRMIPAQADDIRPLGQNARNMRLNCGGRLRGLRIIQCHIAVIGNRKLLKRRETIPPKGRIKRLQT